MFYRYINLLKILFILKINTKLIISKNKKNFREQDARVTIAIFEECRKFDKKKFITIIFLSHLGRVAEWQTRQT